MTSAIQAGLTVRYGEARNPFPEENTLASFMGFVSEKEREGRSFNFLVRVGIPHGVTHDDTNTAFTVNSAVAATHVEASIMGATIVIVDNVPYNDVYATMHGIANGGGQGASYWKKWDECTEGLMLSGDLYRELQIIYGPGPTSTAASSLATVSASVSGANLAAPQVVNITAATWAPGLWPKMIGGLVDIYQSDGTTLRASGVTVTSMVPETNRLTLTKAASGATVAAGDVILARGAIDVSAYGLEAIGANTGTMHGISASTYPQWKVATKAVAGAMSRSVILEAASVLASNGLKDGATLFVSNPTLSDLISEATELQRFTSSGDTSDTKVQGASAVEYKTPAGLFRAVVHPYFKQGMAFALPGGDVCKRVGSTDLTFDDGSGQMLVRPLPDKFGAQMQIASCQAPIITSPWHAMYFTGIVNGADTNPA
jgi:hypothetical protein